VTESRPLLGDPTAGVPVVHGNRVIGLQGIVRHRQAPVGRVPRNDASMAFRLLLEAAAGRPELGLDGLLERWRADADEETRRQVALACDQLAALCRR
jgi:hypothetical protein